MSILFAVDFHAHRATEFSISLTLPISLYCRIFCQCTAHHTPSCQCTVRRFAASIRVTLQISDYVSVCQLVRSVNNPFFSFFLLHPISSHFLFLAHTLCGPRFVWFFFFSRIVSDRNKYLYRILHIRFWCTIILHTMPLTIHACARTCVRVCVCVV